MPPTEVLAHPTPHPHAALPPPPAAHPDLENPELPDAGEDLAWGERQAEAHAGPSRLSPAEGEKRKISPFGAKAVAAMMGAVSTSLLSEWRAASPRSRPIVRPRVQRPGRGVGRRRRNRRIVQADAQ